MERRQPVKKVKPLPAGLSSHFPVTGPVQLMRGLVSTEAHSTGPPPGAASKSCAGSSGGRSSPYQLPAIAHSLSAQSTSDSLRPQAAQSTVMLETAARTAAIFIRDELSVLGQAPTPAGVGAGDAAYDPSRLAIFREALRILLPQFRGGTQSVLADIIREYEAAIEAATRSASQPLRSQGERQRIEDEFRALYTQAADERTAELKRREAYLEQNASATANRVVQLENMLQTAKQEMGRLRAQISDETDRFSTMSQSVLEARLAAQRADILCAEMRERYDRVKVIEKVYMDLLKDHQEMLALLKERGVAFPTRVTFTIAELLSAAAGGGGDGAMAAAAMHDRDRRGAAR